MNIEVFLKKNNKKNNLKVIYNTFFKLISIYNYYIIDYNKFKKIFQK